MAVKLLSIVGWARGQRLLSHFLLLVYAPRDEEDAIAAIYASNMPV